MKNNKPTIRFKGFEEEWKEKKAIELCSISTGKSNTQDNIKEGKYPFYVRSATIERSNRFLFDEEAVLTVGDGVGTGKVYHYVNGKYDLHQRVYRMFDFKEVIGKYFYLFFSNNFQERVTSMTAKSSVDSVRLEMISEMLIKYPSLTEQQQIGTFFQNLDTLITQHQQKHSKLQALKKAMLSKMFPKQGQTTPEIRFKGFSGEWEEKELGEIADIVRGASPRPINDPKWFDEKSTTGWLRISDVTEQNGRITNLQQRISKLAEEKTRVIIEPHLLLSIAASVGKPVINYMKTGVHDGFLIFLNPRFNQEFMFQWLKMFESQWQKYGQPGSQVNLNSEIIKNQKINIPSIEEQQQIGNYFKNLDSLITHHHTQIEKLQNIKKALLAKMFV
jgi:type I restriction enzyme S subunit